MHTRSQARWRWILFVRIFVPLFALIVPSSSWAAPYVPPPLVGHVVDEAGALRPAEARALSAHLSQERQRTGFAVVVFILRALPEGKSIEDIGYEAGNAWGVGSRSEDDGVLLIAALNERKLRIETGKGVGGALTDLQSSRINREIIGPRLKEGRTYEAMLAGSDAILKELVENTPGKVAERPHDRSGRPRATKTTLGDVLWTGGVVLVGLVVIVLAIVSPTFRELLFWFILLGFGRGGRSGRGSDDGYSGGGGRFGGGGSSDDY